MLFLACALAAAPQLTFDRPLVWDHGSGTGEVTRSLEGNRIAVREDDRLFILEADGTESWSATIPPQPPSSLPGFLVPRPSTVVFDGGGGFAVSYLIEENEPTFPQEPGLAGRDLGVIRFDAAGNELWRRRVGSDRDERDGLVVTDHQGGVYVLSSSFDPTHGGPFAPLRSFEVHRLDSMGNTLWGSIPYRPASSGRNSGWGAVQSHPTAGLVINEGNSDPADPDFPGRSVGRFLPDGQRVYLRGAPGAFTRPFVIDDTGAVFAGLSGFDAGIQGNFYGTVALEPDGTTRWQNATLCQPNIAGFDDSGALLACARRSTANFCDDVLLSWPGNVDVRRVHRMDPSTGALLSEIDVPPLVETSASARLRQTDGGHLIAAGLSGPREIRLALPFPSSSATCGAVPNTTGSPAILEANGAALIQDGDLTLFANDLPPQVTTLFVVGFAPGFVVAPGGSRGNLCLAGPIGRFSAPGELRTSSSQGRVALAVDPGGVPTPTALVALSPGQTVYFQAWYRDADPQPTSNFTSAIAVTLN